MSGFPNRICLALLGVFIEDLVNTTLGVAKEFSKNSSLVTPYPLRRQGEHFLLPQIEEYIIK